MSTNHNTQFTLSKTKTTNSLGWGCGTGVCRIASACSGQVVLGGRCFGRWYWGFISRGGAHGSGRGGASARRAGPSADQHNGHARGVHLGLFCGCRCCCCCCCCCCCWRWRRRRRRRGSSVARLAPRPPPSCPLARLVHSHGPPPPRLASNLSISACRRRARVCLLLRLLVFIAAACASRASPPPGCFLDIVAPRPPRAPAPLPRPRSPPVCSCVRALRDASDTRARLVFVRTLP
mgnify:CR=1 FL=1